MHLPAGAGYRVLIVLRDGDSDQRDLPLLVAVYHTQVLGPAQVGSADARPGRETIPALTRALAPAMNPRSGHRAPQSRTVRNRPEQPHSDYLLNVCSHSGHTEILKGAGGRPSARSGHERLGGRRGTAAVDRVL